LFDRFWPDVQSYGGLGEDTLLPPACIGAPHDQAVTDYARLVAMRPSEEWQRKVDEQAAELAQGALSPDDAYASNLWPESLRIGTDAALASFEDELRALKSASDEDVLALVQRVVLALNKINKQHGNAGLMGYETDEREELCDYIDASLEESGIDVAALEARNGIDRWQITGRWRDW
jgi:hypothetical protein